MRWGCLWRFVDRRQVNSPPWCHPRWGRWTLCCCSFQVNVRWTIHIYLWSVNTKYCYSCLSIFVDVWHSSDVPINLCISICLWTVRLCCLVVGRRTLSCSSDSSGLALHIVHLYKKVRGIRPIRGPCNRGLTAATDCLVRSTADRVPKWIHGPVSPSTRVSCPRPDRHRERQIEFGAIEDSVTRTNDFPKRRRNQSAYSYIYDHYRNVASTSLPLYCIVSEEPYSAASFFGIYSQTRPSIIGLVVRAYGENERQFQGAVMPVK